MSTTLPSRHVKDLTGQRFGMLVVVSYYGLTHNGCAKWNCQCDCGHTAIVWAKNLVGDITKSCGCARKGGRPEDRVPRAKAVKSGYSCDQPSSRGSITHCVKLRDQYGFDRVEVLDAVSPKHAAHAAEFVTGDTALVIVPSLTREVTRILGRCTHCGDLVSDSEKSQRWCGRLLCEDCRR